MTAATGEITQQLRGLVVRVLGTPQPQGSKTKLPVRRDGMVVGFNLVDGRRDKAREKFTTWRRELVAAARDAMGGETWLMPGPITLRVTYTMPRPAGHYGTGRNAGQLRASAPTFPAGKPDGGKLQRAVEDALTIAGVWEDDARVVSWHGAKLYPAPDLGLAELAELDSDSLPVPGVVIRVAQIGA